MAHVPSRTHQKTTACHNDKRTAARLIVINVHQQHHPHHETSPNWQRTASPYTIRFQSIERQSDSMLYSNNRCE